MKSMNTWSIRACLCIALGCSLLATQIVLLHAADAPKEENKSSLKLPSAKEVIDRFIKESGGKEAIQKHKSYHSMGKLDMFGQGISGDMEIFMAAPDRFLVKTKIEGFGDMIQGFDGKIGWSMDPAQGPMLLKGEMLDQIKEQAEFYGILHDESKYKSMEVIGVEKFDSVDCYKIKLVRKSEQESYEVFEVNTGLMRGTTTIQATPMGKIPVTTTLTEYKEFDGVKMPTKISQKLSALQQVMKIRTMEPNYVPDSVFELPDPIKALVK
jgi:hypothetical protein